MGLGRLAWSRSIGALSASKPEACLVGCGPDEKGSLFIQIKYSAGPVIGPPGAEVRYSSGSITKTAIIAPPFVGVT